MGQCTTEGLGSEAGMAMACPDTGKLPLLFGLLSHLENEVLR